MGKTNDRCPLQAECDKTRDYIRRELDCPYYHVNARPGYEIDDQEERRRAEWKKAEEAECEAWMSLPRTIETVTGEILDLKREAGEAILDIGARLIEAKGMLSHGEWLPWLNERVELSERTAQKFMRLAREWSNPNTLADLGASKALMLLAVPAEERDNFVEENNVIDMSARQLEQAIKDRDEARKAAETAKAEASLAEQSRAEAVAEMRAKLDKAKAAKAKAEEKRKEAEAALEQAQVQLKDAEQARKNAALSSDEDMATFKVLFQQSQETANKMRGILLKLRNRPDGTAAQGAEKAMKALAEAIGRCAE